MSAIRRILYFTGTRADFGLMRATLLSIKACAACDLSLVVTGMHLDRAYGYTVDDILASGLPVAARVKIEQGLPDGALMARNIGRMVTGFTDVLITEKPDIVLVLGDRGEMLAAAIAALHLNIPIAHIHGGERSGTIDEPVRHAISKLAHLHLVATQDSRERLLRMGEDPAHIVVTGAPGLDGLYELATATKSDLFARYDLDLEHRLALFLYHPVVQEAGSATAGTSAILAALERSGCQVLALRPNSDAGSAEILEVLDEAASAGKVKLVTHLQRPDYLSFLRHADVLVGNSSSGIIEAASFGTPVINIGSRQNLRERNSNVLDVPAEPAAIVGALETALAQGRFPQGNRYGDGHASDRILAALLALDIGSRQLMMKTNAY